jgi:hypothetical protein
LAASGHSEDFATSSVNNHYGTTFDGQTLEMPGVQIVAFLSDRAGSGFLNRLDKWRCYGASGEEMAPSSLDNPTELPHAKTS